ncbi:MAG: glycosyltransferase family 4 protein, partial [bacterium]|nr:glycosyltransferase family 4 protein [bacterium]
LENKINEGYNNIIVTGAPFNLPYYVSLVKKQYPYINIISDFRDTWFKGKPYGFEAMSQKRINEEKSKQINILKFSDSITVPSVQMKSDLQNEFPSQKDKIIHLPHGYDVDEFESKTTESNKNSLNKKIKVIFGGAIYDNLEEHFCNLQKFIDHYKSKVSFEFYTDDVKKIPVALRNNINIHKPLPTALFFKKVKAGDFYLALREDQHKNYISTKFYEIIFLRKPIIFVGEKGLISNLIESNRLGISTTPKELFLKLEKIVKAPKSINYNYNFPVNNYSYTKITEKLLGLIN